MLGRCLSWCLVLAGLLLGRAPAQAQSSSAESARLEPPGPCSRRTPLVVSEIFYHPPSRPDSNNLEFIELHNSQPWPEDLSEFRLTGAIQFTFPAGTRLAGDAVIVVAADPQAIRAIYGVTNVVGPFVGQLQNNSEQVHLRNRSGAVLLEVDYSARPPWPVSPDGGGHSLVLARPSYGPQDPSAWAASDRIGGSPGQLENPGAEPLRGVMLNEILAHSTNPQLDFLELHNQANTQADLSGCHLTDDPGTNKFTFPAGTVLTPGGFVSLTETQLGFALHAAGETLYLINRTGTRVLDAVRFGGQARDVSFGRVPDGGPFWSLLANRTAGLPNGASRSREVLINEIMYAPISRADEDQFVEIHNPGTNQMDLSGWRFVDGIEFTFPANTLLAPNGYLAVVRDLARFQTHYPGIPANRCAGNFSGKLSGRGEHLALAKPETVLSTNLGVIETNVFYCVVDELTYGTGGRWPKWANDGGSSLERINARGDGRLADQWADSDETTKANWTTVEHTARLDFGVGSANALQLFLLGAGECLVDDVEVIDPSGNNLLANPSFESGLAPWTPQGDHDTSFLQATGGVSNSRCLHLRAGGDGDPGANRIRVPLTSAIPVNSNATLRARVRWLRGHPEILLRLNGNYLEAVGTLSVPSNLGTPGAPNGQPVVNLGPSILGVQHQPILPAANQAVVVTARLLDPDGLGPAVLNYRIDPDTNNVFTVPLVDDGSGGDAVAGDGLFSATIPPQAGGKLVAFHVRATDLHASPATRTFPSDAPLRECLVRFGETQPAGKFGTYRLWVTQATFNQWSARAKLSNAALDGTFINGTHRVIYNAGMLYAGSAYHASRYTTPTDVACDYKLVFPSDDLFLGSDEAVIVWPGLTGGDPVDGTAQQEQTSYWVASMLGLPFNYQRYVHLFVNGVRRSFIMQDTQKPDRDSIRQWFPGDDDGELFKVQIWREYDASANNTTASISATLSNFTTVGGIKKTARYRWSWTPRATGKTMNSFSNLFDLVDAVNSPTNTYLAAIESVIDIEQWMRTFAAEHLVCNWDSYGYGNGQNMYAYKPKGDGWKMMIWDMDVSLGNASDPATADLFRLANPFFPGFNGDPAIVDRMYKTPKIARAYWRAIQDAVYGPLAATNLHPLLDAKSAAFAANGVTASSTTAIKNFLNTRRDYCLGRLANVTAGFSLGTPAFFETNQNPVVLSGTAPVEVRDILINGVPVPVTWTSVTSWTGRVTVSPGTNVLVIQGFDRLGQPLEEARATNIVAYTGSPPPHITVLLNEWMASNTNPGGYPNPAGGAFDDWFELYNPGHQTANLAGHYLTDDLNDRFRYLIPPGYAIAPGGYLVVWADGDPSRNSGQSPDLHVSFQLSKGGESIGLFASDGTRIDAVSFGSQTNNISEGRWPDGDSSQLFMTTPTPGAPNLFNGVTNAPVFTSAVLRPGSELALTWRTISGRTYQVDYKNRLEDEIWIELGGTHLADSSQFTLRLPIQSTGQRFYRIRQVD